jgi:16S rRNA (guanine966-N2)-methyltransferase
MRVIAGTAGGIKLDCPQGIARPMMDRVRGAVFSSLGEATVGARAADLFAGSGGLGIEALSRGATSCVFVDSHRLAIAAIRANLLRARLRGETRQMEVSAFLKTWTGEKFDLVFADPPFALAAGVPAHPASLMESGLLAAVIAPGGLFVVELPGAPPAGGGTWELLRAKRYGQAWMAIYRRIQDA